VNCPRSIWSCCATRELLNGLSLFTTEIFLKLREDSCLEQDKNSEKALEFFQHTFFVSIKCFFAFLFPSSMWKTKNTIKLTAILRVFKSFD
jgi:hypothetical protein